MIPSKSRCLSFDQVRSRIADLTWTMPSTGWREGCRQVTMQVDSVLLSEGSILHQQSRESYLTGDEHSVQVKGLHAVSVDEAEGSSDQKGVSVRYFRESSGYVADLALETLDELGSVPTIDNQPVIRSEQPALVDTGDCSGVVLGVDHPDACSAHREVVEVAG